MHKIDRIAARALVEAGYMSMSAYIEMFGADLTKMAVGTPCLRSEMGNHGIKPWMVPAHFASPVRSKRYRISYKRQRSIA